MELPSNGGDGWRDDNNTMGDLHVRSGSPCIDAGDNGLVPAGSTVDLDGTPRFQDDPTMPDTGSGTPPLVDMGCYEHVTADCNHDGKVTLADAADLIACVMGPDAAADTACACQDLSGDGTVDLVDVAMFQMLLGLPAVP